MKVGIIGAGTMGAGIAQAFAMTDGYEVCLCDIKQEFADGGKARILKNLNFLVGKEKISQEKADAIANRLVNLGIQAIWNFAHVDLDLIDKDVVVENVHLSDSLMQLSYNIVKNKQNK